MAKPSTKRDSCRCTAGTTVAKLTCVKRAIGVALGFAGVLAGCGGDVLPAGNDGSTEPSDVLDASAGETKAPDAGVSETGPDGGETQGEAAPPEDAPRDALVCGPSETLAYARPGCGNDAPAPFCLGPGDACVSYFCGCSGQTEPGACGVAVHPYQYAGPCEAGLDGAAQCPCVPYQPPLTDRSISLECACAAGLCQPKPLDANHLTAADCAQQMALFPSRVFPYLVLVTRYDDCGLMDLVQTAIDSPTFVWTIDVSTLAVVGVRYTPWAISPFSLDPSNPDTRLYCNLADAGHISETTQGPPIVAGRSTAGCTASPTVQVCPPRDAGLD